MQNTVIGRILAVAAAVTLLFSAAPMVGTTATAAVAIGPETGTVGTRVSIQGQGFEANTSYDIYFSSQDANVSTARHIGIDIARFKKVLTVSTTFFPSFNAVFDVPEKLDTATGGEYVISHDGDYYVYVAKADSTLVLAKAVFRMTGFAQVEVDPASGNVGDGVIITGKGYVPGEAIAIAWDNRDITTTHIGGTNIVNEAGKFVLTFTIPDSIYGAHYIRVTGSYSEAVVKKYTVIPEIKLNKSEARSGANVSITGTGFGASRNVVFAFDGEPLVVEWVLVEGGRTDEAGRFVVNMVVPDVAPGVYLLAATDAVSGVVTAEKGFTVQAPPLNPRVELSAVNAMVGETVEISGTEFNPGRPVTFTIDGAELVPVKPVTTDQDGNFTGSFVVQALPRGLHNVSASDGVESAVAGFSIKLGLEVTPLKGVAGTEVSVNGNGLEAGVIVSVYLDDRPLATNPASVKATANGTVGFTFTIPPCAPGEHELKIRMGTLTELRTFVTAAEVAVDKDITGVGKIITISLRGFAPDSPLVLSLNGIHTVGLTTGGSGAMEIVYTVPHVPDGVYNLKIEAAGTVIAKEITVLAEAAVSPAAGAVGAVVEVGGFGFWPGKTLYLYWDGAAMPGMTSVPVANADGAFSAVFKVPVAAPGEYTVKVSDGVVVKEMTFTVEKTVPPAPVLVTPADKTKMSSVPYFEWQAVSYPNMDVVYELQIIRKVEISEVVFEKIGLEGLSYGLDKSEKLAKAGPDNPYYWRVRAVDEAGNEGAWSEVNEFYHGFIWPVWLTWVLVGAGVLILGTVIYIFRWRILDLF